MQTTSTLPRIADAKPASSRGRRVVDAPIRMFHWLFALSFVGAYVTADGERWRAMHVTLGYLFAGLLVLRVLYGAFVSRRCCTAWAAFVGGCIRCRIDRCCKRTGARAKAC